MNIFNKIQKDWDFSKSTEENVIIFNNEKNRKQSVSYVYLFCLLLLAISVLTGNVFLLPFVIGAISFSADGNYIFNTNHSIQAMDCCTISSTQFVVCYDNHFKLGTVSSGAISFGAEANTSDMIAGAVMPHRMEKLSSTTFIVVGQRASSSNEGVACIGTISGTTISFGSNTTFSVAYTDYPTCAVLDSTHFVVTYKNRWTNVGGSIIGVISGSTISFGSEYSFNSALPYSNMCCALDSTHFVVMFSDQGDSYKSKVVIGTVASGNQISYGTAVALTTVASYYSFVSKLDSTHFLASYMLSNVGKAVIGTVSSGNSISAGTEYSLGKQGYLTTALDSTHFIMQGFDTVSGYSKSFAYIGTISSGVISFSSGYKVYQAYVGSYNVLCTLDSSTFVFNFTDGSNVSNNSYSKLGIITPDSSIKSINGLLRASIKSVNGLVATSVKSFNGLA